MDRRIARIINEEVYKVITEKRNEKGQYIGRGNNKSLQDAVSKLLDFIKKSGKEDSKKNPSNKKDNKKKYQDAKKKYKSSSKKNEGDKEYTDKHGKKESNGLNKEVIDIASSPGANNAAICRQVEKNNPDIHMDSSYVTKMTQNKPGYSSGTFKWDKEKAQAFIHAANELGLTV